MIREAYEETGIKLNKDDLVLNESYTFILNEIMTSTYNSAFVDYNNSMTESEFADCKNCILNPWECTTDQLED